MAEKDIIQNLIIQPGQSQDQRMPVELGIHYADVDERSDEELLLFTRKFAEYVNFYQSDPSTAAGNWADFFPADIEAIRKLLNDKSSAMAPHLALYLSFLKLYKEGPQESINRFTGKHLDFYFKEVLRLIRKPAVADKAHVILELKKNSPAILIQPEDLFSAGKDKTKVELLYKPTGETVINASKVDSLRSVYHDKTGHGIMRYAPVADSSDGMGGKLQGDEPKWFGFGNEANPAMEVGFALGSTVFRMNEGVRKVILTLSLENVNPADFTGDELKGSFEAFITGEKGWLGPYEITPEISADSKLQFDFTIPSSEKAVIDYNPAIHGYSYSTKSPVVQVLLRTDDPGLKIGYTDFEDIRITKAGVAVEVTGVTSLSLENDNGNLNPKKPFFPFGALPEKGSRFLVGYPEALSKKVSEISIHVGWKNPPAHFADHYSGYGGSHTNDSFTASVAFTYGDNQTYTEAGAELFNPSNATAPQTFVFTPGHPHTPSFYVDDRKIYGLMQLKTQWSKRMLREFEFRRPVKIKKSNAPPAPAGFISFMLKSSFLQAEYQKKSVENIVNFAKGISADPPFTALNQPYVPVIQSIVFGYKAYSDEVRIDSGSLTDFTNDEIQFFHVAYFGQIREHTYQRNLFTFLHDKSVTLLPAYKNEGEMIIGFSDLKAGDSVSVLFQVAEGSEDPDLPQEDIAWSVLCDNYWNPLDSSQVVLDTTNKLLCSGIIKFVIPAEATTDNTLMPSGKIWIKAGIRNNVKAICQLVSVQANAVEVQFSDSGNDLQHLATPLEKNKIAKLRNGNASVKTVTQPYASFAGSQVETDNGFYTRASERLRHKNRAITVWDFERMILNIFPEIHKVKCIPHARFMPELNKYCWLAPGNVVIVVIPDLKNRNAINPLTPKVNSNTISRITQLLKQQSGMQVNIKVKNPSYQKIKLEFKVRFRTGYEFNYYSEALKEQLKQILSPWAYASGRDISFGGKIYKSVILDFVEEVEYVDYVEDFHMYSISEISGQSSDLSEIQPESPDTILVSNDVHLIYEA